MLPMLIGALPRPCRSPALSSRPSPSAGSCVRGFMTMVWLSVECDSARMLIWIAGRQAVIQAGSHLGIHAPAYDSGRPARAPDDVEYLQELGLTRSPIEFMYETLQRDIHWMTIGDVLRLFVPVLLVPSLFGAWRLCPIKMLHGDAVGGDMDSTLPFCPRRVYCSLVARTPRPHEKCSHPRRRRACCSLVVLANLFGAVRFSGLVERM
jgi:hypothetical protein